MTISYKLISKVYGLLDLIYFRKEETSPRKAVQDMIPNEKIKVLDVCCGTGENSIQIAKQHPRAQIVGIDLSKEMLDFAKKNIARNKLTNVRVKAGDATATGFKEKLFDYAIISLVLHEVEENLASGILSEAKRVLKDEGELIVLEWEIPKKLSQKIIFLPIKLLEPKPFKKLMSVNKAEYFKAHGFKLIEEVHCDYSCVYRMKKLDSMKS